MVNEGIMGGIMEYFVSPDVAYLLLVVGLLIATLALVTPGTGVLEVIAFTILAIAGWIVSQLNFNWVAIVILVIGVFPFLLALRKTQKLLFLVISLVALSVGSTFLFIDKNWRPVVHPVLAVLINFLAIGFFWIVIRKGMDAIISKPAHDLSSLVNSTGETKTEVFQEGSVYAGGELWSAISQKPIPANRKVKVINRQGFTLEVEEYTDNS